MDLIRLDGIPCFKKGPINLYYLSLCVYTSSIAWVYKFIVWFIYMHRYMCLYTCVCICRCDSIYIHPSIYPYFNGFIKVRLNSILILWTAEKIFSTHTIYTDTPIAHIHTQKSTNLSTHTSRSLDKM